MNNILVLIEKTCENANINVNRKHIIEKCMFLSASISPYLLVVRKHVIIIYLIYCADFE